MSEFTISNAHLLPAKPQLKVQGLVHENTPVSGLEITIGQAPDTLSGQT